MGKRQKPTLLSFKTSISDSVPLTPHLTMKLSKGEETVKANTRSA